MALVKSPYIIDGLESDWILNSKIRFFEIRKVAIRTLPVSQTYCSAGIDPEDFYNVIPPSATKLQETLVCLK